MTLTRSRLVEAVACACHQQNKAHCESLGDSSQPSWSDAPGWQKTSAIAGVEGALKGNSPEQSHESWLAHKREEGWVWGPYKNPEAKVHPCMVPYSDLPVAQKAKDSLFVSMVRELGLTMGLITNPSESDR